MRPGQNRTKYKYDSAYRLSSTGSGSQGQDVRAFERGTFTSGTRTSMAGGVGFYQDWDLEGLGNWARQDDNARVETRTSSDYNEIVDRVVAGNTATLAHDKNGNVTDTGYTTLGGQNFPGGGLRLEWDALNRLRKAWKNNNTPGNTADDVLVGEYTYDAGNRRMRKVVTNSGSLNGTTDFYYEGWRVLEERDGSDTPINQYVYGNYLDEVWTLDDRRSGGTVVSLNDQTGSNRHFYLANTLYSVYGLTNEGSSTTPGTLREAYEYDAYGRQSQIVDGNDVDNVINFGTNDVRVIEGWSAINGSPLTFTGQRYDSESGLHYFKNRYLTTSLGRFLSRDNVVDISLGLYEYVGGRATSSVDPSGNVAIVLVAAAGLTVAETVALAFGVSVTACVLTPPCRDALGREIEAQMRKLGEWTEWVIEKLESFWEWCKAFARRTVSRGSSCSCVCYKAGVGPDAIGQQPNPAACAIACMLQGYPGFQCGGKSVIWPGAPGYPK